MSAISSTSKRTSENVLIRSAKAASDVAVGVREGGEKGEGEGERGEEREEGASLREGEGEGEGEGDGIEEG